MNTQKIDSRQQYGDCNYEYVNQVGFQQPWNNMGIIRIKDSDQQQNPGPVKSSTNHTIMSGFQSPSSAFYATERCMGMWFPQQSCNSTQFPSFQYASRENFSVGSITGDELGNSLLKSQICFNQYQKPSEMSYNTPSPDQLNRNHFPVPFGGNQDQRVSFFCFLTPIRDPLP